MSCPYETSLEELIDTSTLTNNLIFLSTKISLPDPSKTSKENRTLYINLLQSHLNLFIESLQKDYI